MGSLSDYAENAILDHIVGKTTFLIPTSYIGLKTADPTDDNSGGTEPTAGTGSYARITTSASDWDTAASGATANATALGFAASTAAWSTGATNLTHFIIMDALTGGNLLAHGALTTPRAVDAASIILRFAIGDLDITLT
jgi:hypothetical protein